jgi:hypothetical protein
MGEQFANFTTTREAINPSQKSDLSYIMWFRLAAYFWIFRLVTFFACSKRLLLDYFFVYRIFLELLLCYIHSD